MDEQSDIGEWWLLIVFELDIPSLTEQGIQFDEDNDRIKPFKGVKDLNGSSMNEWRVLY